MPEWVLQSGTKYLPVILERRKNAVGNIVIKKVRERVMASEPFFEERSDAVKMSETPYSTNGSGKNPGRACKI